MPDTSADTDTTEPPRWRSVLRTVVRVVLVALFVALAWVMLPISTLLLTLASVPFYGVLVRYRAHYVPRLEHVDEWIKSREGCESYLAVARRVWRIEGWRGFCKGTIPILLAVIRRNMTVWSMGEDLDTLLNSIPLPRDVATNLVLLPSSIVILVVLIREICASSIVAWYWPRSAVRKLLGPNYSKLAVLATLFNVLLLEFVRILVIGGASFAWRELTKAAHQTSESASALVQILHALSYYAVGGLAKACAAVVVCTLEVLVIRLSVQPFTPVTSKTQYPDEAHRDNPLSESTESEESPLLPENTVTPDEAVVHLRETRYGGLIDAIRRMYHEEGGAAFLRAYWATLLVTVHGKSLTQLFWDAVTWM
ncbi:hypothetical protein BKA62DRAFT_775441 [Auriculariales sp. MPI-PUGE-AT-0066]|nr:hypothetical protein BKA62DRAFT_775441 [Auriculariales sp. MPI-PUGE-AT-0066]